RRQLAEVAREGLSGRRRRRALYAGRRGAAAAVTQTVHGNDPDADGDDQYQRGRRRGHRGHLAYAVPESRERIAEPALSGPARLNAQLELILEGGPRARGLESVVELALQSLQLELVVV